MSSIAANDFNFEEIEFVGVKIGQGHKREDRRGQVGLRRVESGLLGTVNDFKIDC